MTQPNASSLGYLCKLYYNSATHATPTWVEVKRAKDVSVPLSKDEADTSRRESKWKFSKGAQREGALEFGYQYKSGADTVFDMLLDSFLNGTAVQFAVMDGDITASGNQGLRAFMEVFDFPHDEPLADGVVYNIGLKLTDHEESSALVEPDWYAVP